MDTFMDQEAFFTSPLRDYVTIADMARELRVSLESVKSLVERDGPRFSKRHGIVRLWKRRDIDIVREAIERASASPKR
jgi:hypothetical protein